MRSHSLRFLAPVVLLVAMLLSACAGSTAVEPAQSALDRQWLVNMQAGRDAYDEGQYLLSSRLFAQALERGRLMDRAQDIADAAFNLAAAQMQLGDFAAADRSLQQARRESLPQQGPLSEILLLEARNARLMGDRGRARTVVDQLLNRLAGDEGRLLVQARLLSGLLACEAGEVARAQGEHDQASAALGDRPHAAIAAARAELQGCINLRQGRQLDAAAAFDREGDYLKQAGHYRQMVDALFRAGMAYAAADADRLAADRLYRAARSAFSQTRTAEARELSVMAEAAARDSGSQLLLENISQLQREMLLQ